MMTKCITFPSNMFQENATVWHLDVTATMTFMTVDSFKYVSCIYSRLKYTSNSLYDRNLSSLSCLDNYLSFFSIDQEAFTIKLRMRKNVSLPLSASTVRNVIHNTQHTTDYRMHNTKCRGCSVYQEEEYQLL